VKLVTAFLKRYF